MRRIHMSKRDELGNEAAGEKGAAIALATTLVLAALKEGKSISKKNKIKMQIDQNNLEINRLESEINQEERKSFFTRDTGKINALKQKKNQLIKETNDLIAQCKR